VYISQLEILDCRIVVCYNEIRGGTRLGMLCPRTLMFTRPSWGKISLVASPSPPGQSRAHVRRSRVEGGEGLTNFAVD